MSTTTKFQLKPNYFIIPLITILVAYVGSAVTSISIQSGWYDLLNKPAWTPPGSVIGIVWTIIFLLATISALIFWNQKQKPKHFGAIIWIFIANAILNVLWTVIFFYFHILEVAIIEAALLDITTIALIVFLWPISKKASVLLIPYAGWVAFATYLNYVIYTLN